MLTHFLTMPLCEVGSLFGDGGHQKETLANVENTGFVRLAGTEQSVEIAEDKEITIVCPVFLSIVNGMLQGAYKEV